MQRIAVSASVARLSVYHRILTELQANDLEYVSSTVLGAKAGFSDAQVRKDLAFFGSFGRPGKGYAVKRLHEETGKILGKGKHRKVVLVGAGNLGKALLSYAEFRMEGFDIIAAYDRDPKKIGRRCAGLKISDISRAADELKVKGADIAVIAVPAEFAQEVTDILAGAHIKAILNFAPVRLTVPAGVKLHNVDLSVELDKLSHMLGGR